MFIFFARELPSLLCLMLYMYHVHVIVYANKDDDYCYYNYI